MTTLIKLKNRGLANGSLRNISHNLKYLSKYADLNDPESVKENMAKKDCAKFVSNNFG